MIAIVTLVYNDPHLVEAVVEKVHKTTFKDFVHIIVYNHPLVSSWDWLTEFSKDKPNMLLLDPGKNLGCTGGLNFGFNKALELKADYVLKLDDDTLCPDGNDWLIQMSQILARSPLIAMLTPNSNVVANHNSQIVKICNQEVVIYKNGVIGWTCMMMPVKIFKEFGELQGWHPVTKWSNKMLYGGEEAYYCQKVAQKGYCYGYTKQLYAHHMDNNHRDPDYVLWKYSIGYTGMCPETIDCDTFKKDKTLLDKCYQKWLESDNGWYQQQAKEYFKKSKGE